MVRWNSRQRERQAGWRRTVTGLWLRLLAFVILVCSVGCAIPFGLPPAWRPEFAALRPGSASTLLHTAAYLFVAAVLVEASGALLCLVGTKDRMERYSIIGTIALHGVSLFLLVVAGVSWDGPIDSAQCVFFGSGPFALVWAALAQLDALALFRSYMTDQAPKLGRLNLVRVESEFWRNASEGAEKYIYSVSAFVLCGAIGFLLLRGLAYVEGAILGKSWLGGFEYPLVLLTHVVVYFLVYVLTFAAIVLWFNYVRELIVLVRDIHRQQAADRMQNLSR